MPAPARRTGLLILLQAGACHGGVTHKCSGERGRVRPRWNALAPGRADWCPRSCRPRSRAAPTVVMHRQ
ncbi:hypothetical protein SLNWT_1452 [Streptomyces albus]|uniref:Uncharacterized protein n=1 Tax=Streptomyces albus (strain ATCC 21838 / DSM 41398 / FERM P-419 / JCM 4703 / NBRC 107858) TaxID=1081613 RepID=A0A0B5EI30_STRA4|nr:hypothetical protein SLNWT_1452 [Streptomyces albus]AOU76144.1 hypothetical protein SLNHY_1453 [Streptomyces albus]AYN31934.1 hypothetical protein DUI70_1432 [Streptomyces albus]